MSLQNVWGTFHMVETQNGGHFIISFVSSFTDLVTRNFVKIKKGRGVGTSLQSKNGRFCPRNQNFI